MNGLYLSASAMIDHESVTERMYMVDLSFFLVKTQKDVQKE